MNVYGKVVAKIQQEGGVSMARIQVYKKKKTAAAAMRIFDIIDDGELNIGDEVIISVNRKIIAQYEPNFVVAKPDGCMFHSAPDPALLADSRQFDTLLEKLEHEKHVCNSACFEGE
jgi:hypothetical protein